MNEVYTIIIFTENKPGVLYRISDLFLRRKVNIESLTVSEVEKTGISRFTIVIFSTKAQIEKIVKQLYRIIEVLKVLETKDSELIFKEVSFIKIGIKNEDEKAKVKKIATEADASTEYENTQFVVFEKTGTEEEVNNFRNLFEGFQIREFVRSGRTAVLKDEGKFKGKFNPVQSMPDNTDNTEVA